MSVGDLVTAWQNPFFSTIFFYFIKLILVEDPALSKAPVVTGQTSSQQVSSVGGTSLHPAFLPLASYFLPCILASCLILPPLHPARLPLASYFLPCILASCLPSPLRALQPLPGCGRAQTLREKCDLNLAQSPLCVFFSYVARKVDCSYSC